MQLGKYQLVAEIARGGMGIVYLAVVRGPARFNKLLVVKELKPDLADDPTFLAMFLEEARLAARLNHPNIVQTYEVGGEGDRPFMVMDYLEGMTLARVLRRRLPGFTLGMHLRVICEVLQGLHYAHTLHEFDGTPLGIVHRDATPQNVFITFDGQVKLVDFGIAKTVDSSIETMTGVIKGKPAYMAPEQITGDADPRADVFTVGVMLWEALAGRRMWAGKNDVEVLTSMMRGDVPKVAEVAPNAPAELVAICHRALAHARTDRPASALELQTAIEDYLRRSGTDVPLRELGRVVTEGFAAERSAVRGVIDAHLATIAAGQEPLRLPSLPIPSRSLHAGPESGTPVSGVSGTSGATSMILPQIAPPRPSSHTGPMIPIAPAASFLAPPPHEPLPRRGRLLGTIGVSAIFGVLLAIGVLFTVQRMNASSRREADARDRAAADNVPSVPGAGIAAPANAEAGQESHEVHVRTMPSAAVLTIDGAEVSNPVTKQCTRAFTVHASLPGHQSADRTLKCDRDETIEIALVEARAPAAWAGRPVVPPPHPVVPPPHPTHAAVPGSAAAPASATGATPATRPPGPQEVSSTGGVKPLRPIETNTPYGNR